MPGAHSLITNTHVHAHIIKHTQVHAHIIPHTLVHTSSHTRAHPHQSWIHTCTYTCTSHAHTVTRQEMRTQHKVGRLVGLNRAFDEFVQDLFHGFAHYITEHVEASPVRHADRDCLAAHRHGPDQRVCMCARKSHCLQMRESESERELAAAYMQLDFSLKRIPKPKTQFQANT